MRLIDADALLKAIEDRLKEPEYQHHGEDWYVGMNTAAFLVYEQPTIEIKERR